MGLRNLFGSLFLDSTGQEVLATLQSMLLKLDVLVSRKGFANGNGYDQVAIQSQGVSVPLLGVNSTTSQNTSVYYMTAMPQNMMNMAARANYAFLQQS